MRIIAGTHRSRTILSPPPHAMARPITDRAKQSLFDRLASHGMLGGGVVVDLFAGTGSLGLEALSRGADYCIFIENDRASLAMLKQNIAELRFDDRAMVMSTDALNPAWSHRLPRSPLWLGFCDPPYAMTSDEGQRVRVEQLVDALADAFEPEGVLMVRTEEEVTLRASEGWLGPEAVTFGSMVMHFYEKAGAGE